MTQGKDIRALRLQTSRTQRQAAKEMGISTVWLAEIEITRADRPAPEYAQKWYAETLKEWEQSK